MTDDQQQVLTDDPRLRIEGRPLKFWTSKTLISIFCAGCGTGLAVSNDEERGVRLAVNNCTQRPCCDLWRRP